MPAFPVIADWAEWASGILQMQFPQDPQQVVQLVSDPKIARLKVRVSMSGILPFQLHGSDVIAKFEYTRGYFIFRFGNNAGASIGASHPRANRAFDAVYELYSLLDVYRSAATIGASARLLARINYLNELIPTVMRSAISIDPKREVKRRIKLYTPLKLIVTGVVRSKKRCLKRKH